MNGNPIKPAASEVAVAVPVADDLGGVFIVWLDRTPGETAQHLRATRLLGSGLRDPRWPVDGVWLGYYSGDWMSKSDLRGGLYVLVQANGSRRILRLQSDGTLDPVWSVDGGRPIRAVPSGGYAVDRSGGIWAMANNYDTFCIPDFPGHCFTSSWYEVARLTSDGTPVPGWEGAGKRISIGGFGTLISDYLGSVPVGGGMHYAVRMRNTSVSGGSIRLLEFLPDGNLNTLLAYGERSDFEVGAFAADAAGRDFLIRGNYFDPTIMARWQPSGVLDPFYSFAVPDYFPAPEQLVADDLGGAYVSLYLGSFTQNLRTLHHVTPTGAPDPRWPPLGRLLESQSPGSSQNALLEQRMIPDQQTGCFITWYESRAGADAEIFALRVAPDGSIPDGWPDTGFPVTQVSGSAQLSPYSSSDRFGSVFVVWKDMRGGGANAYVQKFSNSAPVPTQVVHTEGRWQDNHVELSWGLSSTPADDLVVERGSDAEGWLSLGPLVSGRSRDEWVFSDRTAPAGRWLSYRLHETQSGWIGGQLDVAPLSSALRLSAPRPNPWSASSTFALELPDNAPAELVVIDPQGRHVLSRRVHRTTARQVLSWPELATLRDGLYWIRVTQGSRTTNTRIVIAR